MCVEYTMTDVSSIRDVRLYSIGTYAFVMKMHLSLSGLYTFCVHAQTAHPHAMFLEQMSRFSWNA